MNKLKFIQELSIKYKIIAIILFVTILIISLGFSFIAIWDIKRLKSETQSDLVLNAKLIGNYCVIPLTFGDYGQATEVLSRLKYIDFIEIGCLYDKSDKLFAKYPETLSENSFLALPDQQINTFKNGLLYVREPIIFQNESYGTIYIEANLTPLTKVKRTIILTFSLTTLVLTLLAAVLADRLQRYISHPIVRLKRHFDKIAENQDYSLSISKQSNDEIGSLYDGFNNLLEQIQVKSKERDSVLEKLQNSTDKLNLALSGGETGVWEWDLKTDITIWDARMEKMFGLDIGEFKQNYQAFKDLLNPDDIASMENAIQNALEGISPYNTVYRVICKNKDTRYIKARALVSKDLNGKALKMTGVCFDFTEVKNAEEKLKIHQEHLEELVKERTKKLEEKNIELENMNNVFVDREYRIKELKDKIANIENDSDSK